MNDSLQCLGTHTCHHSTGEAEGEGSQSQRQSRVHNEFQPTHTGVLYQSGVLLSPGHKLLQSSHRREMKLTFTLLPIQCQFSLKEYLTPWSRRSPFHEEDSKAGQKAHQKSFGKIAFREDWSPSFFLSLMESITLSWVLSHSFYISFL